MRDKIKYKVLRDLPNIAAGKTVTLSKSGVNYCCQDNKGYSAELNRKLVENNPDWFELIPPPSIKEDTPVKERIEVGKMACVEILPYGSSKLKWQLQFKTNKYIHYDKAVELCNSLEAALNEDTVVPSIDEAGVIAVKALESIEPKLNEREQAMFIAGFQECIKWQKVKTDTVVEDKKFVWTDEMVLLLCDLCHHNGWHRFDKRIVDEFDEFKSIPCHKRMIPQWIKDHVNKVPNKVEDKPRPLFDDVIIFSINDFKTWYERWYPSNPMKEVFLNGLTNLAKEKLKQ